VNVLCSYVQVVIMAGAIYLPSDVFPRDTELSVIC
jgi:hypothetical protein